MYPPDFTYPSEKYETAQLAAQCIAGLAGDHRVVVQAGGCVGLWPFALSKMFAHVYTFEPEPTNFHYLKTNVAACPNVSAARSALGDERRGVSLARTRAQAGLWRVDGDGEIPMIPLDDVMGAAPVDAIVLDVEGFEVPALRGAAQVIRAHRPLLWFEFLQHTDAIAGVLAGYGYTTPARAIGGDCYSVHTSRMH